MIAKAKAPVAIAHAAGVQADPVTMDMAMMAFHGLFVRWHSSKASRDVYRWFWGYSEPYRLYSEPVQTEFDIHPDTDFPLRPAVEPWDISASYQYSRTFSKTVTEGTWLRLTVHPKLDEIVFDMLGDLYCMSIDHGHEETVSAHPFLSGIPYDKEAEFSPDGSNIVFISDAGFGVDNIWTMPYTSCADMGGRSSEYHRHAAVQQTNDTFRFYSSPAFHPVEPRLIATKWFLTGRPNGAGEIWEFPLISTADGNLPAKRGRRVVARKLPSSWPASRYGESQLGAEQARYVTGDNNSVIYTCHVRDDDTGKFSYNRDVHAGINAVFLQNTASGLIKEIVAARPSAPNQPASPGGASMPRISPDGSTLAFVRRIDDKSVLAVKDMRSGTVRYVWQGLEYDLSTILMGAYPNYGWTTRSDAIIIWSQGQIWRVPLARNPSDETIAGGPARVIPFKAQIELSLAETRYWETNITASEVSHTGQVNSLRHARSDLLGRKVVLEAAGDNFIIDVAANAQARRITKPEADSVCYEPSFVHETTWILQACWHAVNLTTFHLSSNGSHETWDVIGLPRGRYTSPVANSEFIAFVRTGKDYMHGDIEETFGEGVWVGSFIPPAGSSPAVISNLRHIPSLPTSPTVRLDLTCGEVSSALMIRDATSVIQYDLVTQRQKSVVTGKTTTEMAVSSYGPGQAVVIQDHKHVWLYTLKHNVKTSIWSKPGDSDTPKGLVRLSTVGGHDVSFSGDGKRVFWLSGPMLHVVDVDEVVQSCSRASAGSKDCGTCVIGLVTQVPITDDVLGLISASGSSYTPLAVMNYGGIFGQHWIHQTQNIPGDAKLRNYLKHDILESLYEVKQAPKSSYQFFNKTRSTAKLAALGVRTNVGSHGEQPIGYLYHSEMEKMALGGQSPLQVLQHATIGGATSLGLNGSVGSIKVGKLTDIVIYPPGVDDIDKAWRASKHIRYVVRGGTVFSVEDGLEEVWPRAGRRQVMGRLNAEYED